MTNEHRFYYNILRLFLLFGNKSMCRLVVHSVVRDYFYGVFLATPRFMDVPIKKIKKEELSQAHNDFAKILTKRAFFKLHDISLSEDLVQETFLKTWKFILKGGEIETMKAFLYHVLNNLIIDEYRKRQHRASSLELLMENGFDVSTSEHRHKGESIDLDTAIEYIDKIPKKYKEVVHMKIVLSMSTDEIALNLKRTKNSVTVQLHRGLKLIQSIHEKKVKDINKKIK